MKQEVGYVDNIVDRVHSNCAKRVGKPVGRRANFHATDCQAAISGTALSVVHFNDYSTVVGTVNGKGLNRRAMQPGVFCMAVEPGGEIACHAIMRGCVNTVGSKVHFENIIVLDIEIFGCGSAGRNFAVDYNNAIVTCANAYFVLGANHAERLHATYFGFLDGEFLLIVVELCSDSRHHHSLSGSYIGRATYNLSRLSIAKVAGCDMQMVAVGMLYTGKHFTYDKTSQAALYSFDALDRSCFEANRGERGRYFFRAKGEIEIAFQPVI